MRRQPVTRVYIAQMCVTSCYLVTTECVNVWVLMFVGKFQTDVVKDWAKELYCLRSQAYSQHANDVGTEVTL